MRNFHLKTKKYINASKEFFVALAGFSFINIIRAIAPFLLLPLLTRKLTASDYGILSIVESTVLLLTPLLLFNSSGFLSARYYTSTLDKVSQINFNALGLAFLSSLVLQIVIGISGNYVGNLLGLDESYLMLLPAFVFVRMLNTYIGTILQIRQDLSKYGAYSIGTTFADMWFSLVFVLLLNYGLAGRLAGIYISAFLVSAIGLYYLNKSFLIKAKFSFITMIEIVKFGTPLILHSLGGVSLAVGGRFILGNKLGTEAVGVFMVAYQMASAMLLVGTSFNMSWSVKLFKLLAAKNIESYREIRRTMVYLVMLLTIACFGIYVCREILFTLLIGENFSESRRYFPMLLLGFYFQSVYFIFINFDFFEERTISIGVTTFLTAIINIFLNILLIPRFGIEGSVYALTVSLGCYTLLVIARVSMRNNSFRVMWRSQ